MKANHDLPRHAGACDPCGAKSDAGFTSEPIPGVQSPYYVGDRYVADAETARRARIARSSGTNLTLTRTPQACALAPNNLVTYREGFGSPETVCLVGRDAHAEECVETTVLREDAAWWIEAIRRFLASERGCLPALSVLI